MNPYDWPPSPHLDAWALRVRLLAACARGEAKQGWIIPRAASSGGDPGGPAVSDPLIEGFDIKRLVSANKKLHYQHAGKVRAYWRKLGHDLVIAHYGYADVGETWHTRLHITMTFRWPNRIRRDDHNYYPYVIKPLIDGMVDARLIPDDNERHLVGPDVRRDPERGPHRIALRIEDVA